MSEAATTDGTADAGTENNSTEAKTTEWYEGELRKVRAEAAKYRTAKNEAVDAAKAEVAAEWQAKLDAAEKAHGETRAQLSKSEVDLLKVRAALDADVPAKSALKFASLLQGTTEEEIKAHAEEVRGLFGAASGRVPAVDPSPTGAGAIPLNGDPLEDALKSALGIS
jgi:hypothetical protein